MFQLRPTAAINTCNKRFLKAATHVVKHHVQLARIIFGVMLRTIYFWLTINCTDFTVIFKEIKTSRYSIRT